MANKHIALVGINQFDPKLRDGGSATMFEVMRYLRSRGGPISILNYLSNDICGQYKYASAIDINKIRDEKVGMDGRPQKINFYQETLPYGFADAQKLFSSFIKKNEEAVKRLQIEFIITLDDLFSALFLADWLGIPGAHYFHSLSNVRRAARTPYFSKLLQKRAIFACSDFLKNSIKDLFGCGAVVWYPRIDFSKYRVEIKSGEKIGFYSSGRGGKGDEVFFQIVEKRPQLNFLVVGTKSYAQYEKYSNNIEHLGMVSDLREFYGRIKLLLVPSLVEEAFSRVVLEAAANGIPVIANKVGGIPEAMADSGILIEVNSDEKNYAALADRYVLAIDRLLNDREEYAIFSKKARLRAGEYEREQDEMSRSIYEKYINPG